jgi:hypothetical protein
LRSRRFFGGSRSSFGGRCFLDDFFLDLGLFGFGRSFAIATFQVWLRAGPPFRFFRVGRALLGARSSGLSAALGNGAGDAFGLFLCEDFLVKSFGIGCHWFSRVVV